MSTNRTTSLSSSLIATAVCLCQHSTLSVRSSIGGVYQRIVASTNCAGGCIVPNPFLPSTGGINGDGCGCTPGYNPVDMPAIVYGTAATSPTMSSSACRSSILPSIITFCVASSPLLPSRRTPVVDSTTYGTASAPASVIVHDNFHGVFASTIDQQQCRVPNPIPARSSLSRAANGTQPCGCAMPACANDLSWMTTGGEADNATVPATNNGSAITVYTPMMVTICESSMRIKVDPMSIQDKYQLGYQQWHSTPKTSSWFHWDIDSWPDYSNNNYDSGDLISYDSVVRNAATYGIGSGPVMVFDDNVPSTAARHFEWASAYGVDTFVIQRFLPTGSAATAIKNQQLIAALRLAEQYGRTVWVEYDLSGMSDESDMPTFWSDVASMMATNAHRSAAYQQHRGRPLIGVYGAGVRTFSAEWWMRITAQFRAFGFSVAGGISLQWASKVANRTAFIDYDILSPWSVGSVTTAAGYSTGGYLARLKSDASICAAAGVAYMPITFPGFSWYNIVPGSALNPIPRLGGAFLQAQYDALTSSVPMSSLFGAMFDETDEGTAMLPLAESAMDLPLYNGMANMSNPARHVHQQIDGYLVPSDHYMCMAMRQSSRMKSPINMPCPIGATPAQCSIVDYCATGATSSTLTSMPLCRHGGVCTPTAGTGAAVCTCAVGWTGRSCLTAANATTCDGRAYAVCADAGYGTPVNLATATASFATAAVGFEYARCAASMNATPNVSITTSTPWTIGGVSLVMTSIGRMQVIESASGAVLYSANASAPGAVACRIADGRSCTATIDAMGRLTLSMPTPILPSNASLVYFATAPTSSTPASFYLLDRPPYLYVTSYAAAATTGAPCPSEVILWRPTSSAATVAAAGAIVPVQSSQPRVIVLDPCAPTINSTSVSQCANGASCTFDSSSITALPQCVCAVGWGGPRCATSISCANATVDVFAAARSVALLSSTFVSSVLPSLHLDSVTSYTIGGVAFSVSQSTGALMVTEVSTSLLLYSIGAITPMPPKGCGTATGAGCVAEFQQNGEWRMSIGGDANSSYYTSGTIGIVNRYAFTNQPPYLQLLSSDCGTVVRSTLGSLPRTIVGVSTAYDPCGGSMFVSCHQRRLLPGSINIVSTANVTISAASGVVFMLTPTDGRLLAVEVATNTILMASPYAAQSCSGGCNIYYQGDNNFVFYRPSSIGGAYAATSASSILLSDQPPYISFVDANGNLISSSFGTTVVSRTANINLIASPNTNSVGSSSTVVVVVRNCSLPSLLGAIPTPTSIGAALACLLVTRVMNDASHLALSSYISAGVDTALTVALSMLQSGETDTRFNLSTMVDSQYARWSYSLLLHRLPSVVELTTSIAAIASAPTDDGLSPSGRQRLVSSILMSDEFAATHGIIATGFMTTPTTMASMVNAPVMASAQIGVRMITAKLVSTASGVAPSPTAPITVVAGSIASSWPSLTVQLNVTSTLIADLFVVTTDANDALVRYDRVGIINAVGAGGAATILNFSIPMSPHTIIGAMTVRCGLRYRLSSTSATSSSSPLSSAPFSVPTVSWLLLDGTIATYTTISPNGALVDSYYRARYNYRYGADVRNIVHVFVQPTSNTSNVNLSPPIVMLMHSVATTTTNVTANATAAAAAAAAAASISSSSAYVLPSFPALVSPSPLSAPLTGPSILSWLCAGFTVVSVDTRVVTLSSSTASSSPSSSSVAGIVDAQTAVRYVRSMMPAWGVAASTPIIAVGAADSAHVAMWMGATEAMVGAAANDRSGYFAQYSSQVTMTVDGNRAATPLLSSAGPSTSASPLLSSLSATSASSYSLAASSVVPLLTSSSSPAMILASSSDATVTAKIVAAMTKAGVTVQLSSSVLPSNTTWMNATTVVDPMVAAFVLAQLRRIAPSYATLLNRTASTSPWRSSTLPSSLQCPPMVGVRGSVTAAAESSDPDTPGGTVSLESGSSESALSVMIHSTVFLAAASGVGLCLLVSILACIILAVRRRRLRRRLSRSSTAAPWNSKQMRRAKFQQQRAATGMVQLAMGEERHACGVTTGRGEEADEFATAVCDTNAYGDAPMQMSPLRSAAYARSDDVPFDLPCTPSSSSSSSSSMSSMSSSSSSVPLPSSSIIAVPVLVDPERQIVRAHKWRLTMDE